MDKLTRLTIQISSDSHKWMKTVSSIMGISMKELIILSVDEFLEKNSNKIKFDLKLKQKTNKN